MTEGTPKPENVEIVSPKEILRAIQKKLLNYQTLGNPNSSHYRPEIGATLKAFNAIVAYYNTHRDEVDEMKQLPENWAVLGLSETPKFLLVKEVDGELKFASPKFGAPTPEVLLMTLRNYHEITHLKTKSEAIRQGLIQADVTPIDFEKRSQDIGRLWRERAGIIPPQSVETTPETTTPAVLQITDNDAPVTPRIIPRRPPRL
ncbi:MAG: hypothetical protein MUF19_03155 [Candidatus Pacebacteria bacterium]|jgi:hypothetical protein|nr:hypothetical protein [Candidatus Paceibacterota bacterium]